MRPGPNDGGTIKHVLLTIAAHPGTSGEIARKAQVSIATVTKFVRRLLDENLIHVSGKRSVGYGAGRSVYAAGPAPGTAETFDVQAALARIDAQVWQQDRRRIERRTMKREVALERRASDRRVQPAGDPMDYLFGRVGAA